MTYMHSLPILNGAGEVSIPNKCVHRRFVIDQGEDVSEYDIAEQLWTTIGG